VVLVALVSASLALGTSTLASAQAPQTPQQKFQAALRLYNHNLFVINLKFRAAIGNDKAIEVAALAAAKSPAQKYLARVDFNEARAIDVSNWEADLKKLGPPPLLWMFTHPTITTTTGSNSF
jgi:hypothetical protein